MSPLFIASLFLYIFGLFNLLGIKPQFFNNQLIFGVVGIFIYIIVRRIGLPFFRVNAKVFYWLFIGILLITYVIGSEIKGSKRWIDFYFFSFQASEFLKIFFMIFMADFFVRSKKSLHELSYFLKSLFYFALPALIIFKQPDLGSAIVYVSIYFSIAFFSGVPLRNIAKVSVLLSFVVPLGWLLLKEYQKARFLSFLNPHLDASGTSYNMLQAIITVGSGNFLGRGLGAGTQSELFFLPENHTDFAYSSLVEQFGFIGGLAVIIIYMAIAFLLIKKIIKFYYDRSEDGKFKFLLTMGFFSFFIVQVFINVGMNLGIMPITGITLPLISYGGSSLITWIIALALIL